MEYPRPQKKRKPDGDYSTNPNTVRELERRKRLKQEDPDRALNEKNRKAWKTALAREEKAVKETTRYQKAAHYDAQRMLEKAGDELRERRIAANKWVPEKNERPGEFTVTIGGEKLSVLEQLDSTMSDADDEWRTDEREGNDIYSRAIMHLNAMDEEPPGADFDDDELRAIGEHGTRSGRFRMSFIAWKNQRKAYRSALRTLNVKMDILDGLASYTLQRLAVECKRKLPKGDFEMLASQVAPVLRAGKRLRAHHFFTPVELAAWRNLSAWAPRFCEPGSDWITLPGPGMWYPPSEDRLLGQRGFYTPSDLFREAARHTFLLLQRPLTPNCVPTMFACADMIEAREMILLAPEFVEKPEDLSEELSDKLKIY